MFKKNMVIKHFNTNYAQKYIKNNIPTVLTQKNFLKLKNNIKNTTLINN